MYANKRSEMWDGMAKWLKSGAVIPNHGELKTDLATPTYSFNAAGRLVLEPKDDIKKRGLRSTDIADALALTFAMPVAPRGLSTRLGRRWAVTDDYDPFAEISDNYEPFAESRSVDLRVTRLN
jgi:hypothetical protein